MSVTVGPQEIDGCRFRRGGQVLCADQICVAPAWASYAHMRLADEGMVSVCPWPSHGTRFSRETVPFTWVPGNLGEFCRAYGDRRRLISGRTSSMTESS